MRFRHISTKIQPNNLKQHFDFGATGHLLATPLLWNMVIVSSSLVWIMLFCVCHITPTQNSFVCMSFVRLGHHDGVDCLACNSIRLIIKILTKVLPILNVTSIKHGCYFGRHAWASVAGSCPPWIFIYGTEKVEKGLMVLFFRSCIFCCTPSPGISFADALVATLW